MAHHLAGSTSAFRQLATEGEAQFVSRSTFEGPCTSSIGCEEGSGPYSPEEQDFFHPSGDHCSGARPRSCNLVQSQRCIAEGKGEFQAVTESAYREEPRRSRGGSTSQSVSPPSCSGSVGSRQPRRRTPQSISGSRQATVPRSTCGGTVGFVSEVCGTRPRTRGTTEKNRRGSTAGLGQLRVTVGRRAARSGTIAPPPTHNEPASETTELRELRLEVEQLKRERNQWMGKTNNSQAIEVVGDSRSTRMASLINEADAKRRCVEPVS